MREEYYRRIVAPVGMSANKWEELRRWCREEAKRRKVNVIKLYSEHDVVTPREYESLTDSEKEKHRAAWRDEARRKANRAKAKASGDMAAELRTYLTNRDVMERAAAKIDKLQEHIAEQQLDIVTLGQEVGRLRGAIMQCETIVRQFQLENEERGKSAISNNARLKYRAVAARSGVLLCSVKKIARAALGEEEER